MINLAKRINKLERDTGGRSGCFHCQGAVFIKHCLSTDEEVLEKHLLCRTVREIGESVGLSQSTINNRIARVCSESFLGTKVLKLSRFELDRNESGEEVADENGWKRPIYDVWAFARKTNSVSHFGNSEQRIIENLLYLYTNPFDIVIDPFAGGGSTIDACKQAAEDYPRKREIKPCERFGVYGLTTIAKRLK